MEKGYLTLETGEIFPGTLIGNQADTIGEVVFNTSMTGYQEILTDPSYAGQIVVFCYPMIGNYGVNSFDHESQDIQVAGVITGEICELPSHFQAIDTVNGSLTKKSLSGLTGIDTRGLVKTLRKHGTVKGIISKEIKPVSNITMKPFTSTHWVDQVSVTEPCTFQNPGPHIVLVDFGYKKSILNSLLKQGCKVTVVPYTLSYKEIKKYKPDGVLFSNGPGDPLALKSYLPEIKKISENYPSFGICLGHQLLGLAHGGKTVKLSFGHRGANHSVKELKTGKVFITSQNHGYVVLEESLKETNLIVTYRNINDQSIEGLEHKYLPIYTVQFHPEANPGPHDTLHLFEHFINQLKGAEVLHYATT